MGFVLFYNCFIFFYFFQLKQRLPFPCWRGQWIKLWNSWSKYCSWVLYDAKQWLVKPWLKLWSSWPGDCSCVQYDAKPGLKLKEVIKGSLFLSVQFSFFFMLTLNIRIYILKKRHKRTTKPNVLNRMTNYLVVKYQPMTY